MNHGGARPASDSAATRASLLLRVRDLADRAAWTEFIGLYGPFIYSYARSRGLQDADAADLTQEVLASVAQAVGRFEYDASRGRFRGWLLNATRNKLINLADRASRRPAATGGSQIAELIRSVADSQSGDAEFQRRHDWHLFLESANRVRTLFTESTWQSFWLNAVEGVPAQQVADSVGATVGAVYIAKSRVLNAIREQLASIADS